MNDDDAFAFIIAELDKLKVEAPLEAADIAAELNEHRVRLDQRITERPGAEWEWNR